MADKTLSKQPAETRIFGMSYTNKLRSSTEVISSIDIVSIYPDDSTLTAISHSFGSDKANILVGAGISGRTYKITVLVTTSDGQILENEGLLIVSDE